MQPRAFDSCTETESSPSSSFVVFVVFRRSRSSSSSRRHRHRQAPSARLPTTHPATPPNPGLDDSSRSTRLVRPSVPLPTSPPSHPLRAPSTYGHLSSAAICKLQSVVHVATCRRRETPLLSRPTAFASVSHRQAETYGPE
jgi:hypothetical protein